MIFEDRYVPFLIEHSITQPQYLLMHLLYKKRYDLIISYKKRFPTDDKTMIGMVPTLQLITEGFIEPIEGLEEGKPVKAAKYVLTDKFTSIFIDTYEAGNEFWDLYPAYSSQRYPLTLMDKNEFRVLYAERINQDIAEHHNVMLDLQYAVEQDLVKGKIETAVKSEIWSAWRKLRFGNETTGGDYGKEDF